METTVSKIIVRGNRNTSLTGPLRTPSPGVTNAKAKLGRDQRLFAPLRRAFSRWNFSDFLAMRRRFEALERTQDVDRLEGRLYGLQWEILGYAFEVQARAWLKTQRLPVVQEMFPEARFFGEGDVRFRVADHKARDFDGIAATLDDSEKVCAIHEVYEMKSSRCASLEEAFEQLIATRSRIENRGRLAVRTARGFEFFRVRFEPVAPFARRNLTLVFTEDHETPRTIFYAVPVLRVPFERAREIKKIHALLSTIFPERMICPIPSTAETEAL